MTGIFSLIIHEVLQYFSENMKISAQIFLLIRNTYCISFLIRLLIEIQIHIRIQFRFLDFNSVSDLVSYSNCDSILDSGCD